MNQFLENMFTSDYGSNFAGPETLLLALSLAFCLGHLTGWVYMWTHSGLSYSQSFVSSLIALTILVTLIMNLVSANPIIAFGLLAVFGMVRFRNVLKDSRDTTFILWSVGQGLGLGTLQFSSTFLGSLCVAAVFLYLAVTQFGARHRYDFVLSMQRAEDDLAASGIEQVLRRHSMRIDLTNQRKLPERVLDASYRLLLRDPTRSDELVQELEAITGVTGVTLYRHENESEM